MRNQLITLCLLLNLLPALAAAQSQEQTLGSPAAAQARAARPSRPVPRHADGRINLGPPAGEAGLWTPAGIVQLVVNPDSVNRANPSTRLPNAIGIADVPFQPWAKALHAARQANTEADDPHTRCQASGGARQFITPYGVEFIDIPELKRIFIIDVGGPHTYRVIYMDGREHPKDLEPTAYGHNIGRWEGDTLVVDRVGFNEKFWIDREGIPHTSQLHMVERFTRTDFNTLRYEITIDDPGAYTAPWTGGFLMNWSAGTEPFEYSCQDNNRSPEAMGEDADTRRSIVVP
jgi:hypothetical protein